MQRSSVRSSGEPPPGGSPESPRPEGAPVATGSADGVAVDTRRLSFDLKTGYIIIFAGVVILYLLGINPWWRFQRDSAIYMALGRSLAEGEGYVENYRFHTMYPPGFPAMLALLDITFGAPEKLAGGFLPMNVLVTVLGLASIVFFALLLRELRLPGILALLVLLFWGVSRTLYYYSAHIMSDVPYTACAMASLWCGFRMLRENGPASWAWCIGAGVLAIVASAVRPVGPVLVAAMIGALWLRRGSLRAWRGNLAKSLLLVALIALPLLAWLAYTRNASAAQGKLYFRGRLQVRTLRTMARVACLHLFDSADGLSDAVTGTRIGAVPGLLLGVVMTVGLIRAFRRGETLLSIYGVLNVVAIMAGGWALGRRYLLPALPALYYWLVLGAERMLAWGKDRRWISATTARRIAIVAAFVLAGTNVGRVIRIVAECRSPRFYETVEDGRCADYAAVTDWLRPQPRESRTVMCTETSTVHYFSRWRTVPLPRAAALPTCDALAERVKRSNVRYVVLDERKNDLLPLLERLRKGRGELVRSVMKHGRVEVIEISDMSPDPSEPEEPPNHALRSQR